MSISVAIVGITGYAGGEIARLLLNHPAFLDGRLNIGTLAGNKAVDRRIDQVSPHLIPLGSRTVEAVRIAHLFDHGVVFLCLPHGISSGIVEKMEEYATEHDVAMPRIIDCGADFRLKEPEQWVTFYGSPHAGTWLYGLPEMPGHRAAIAASTHVAVPGCFPTGATLAVLPAVRAGIVSPDFVITSFTGVSGAGKKADVGMLGAETMGSARAYKTGGVHRHVPEIIQNFKEISMNNSVPNIAFTPVLAPMQRGILSIVSAPLSSSFMQLDCDTRENKAREIYEIQYSRERFISFLPSGVQPQTQAVLGSNMCQVQVSVDQTACRLLMISSIDNLTKGTAGVAIQCMNIMLGFPEGSGLPCVGVAP